MGMFCESNDVLFDVYGCFFVPVANRYDGCFNGFDYDCCTHRRPNLYYPSLVKPFPYYYRCINRRVVYGRCGANQCVTESGSCGESDETLMSTFVYRYFVLLQIDHVRLILFVIKQCTWFIILFSKNNVRQFIIFSVIIQVEAIHIVYKTYMFDVEERTVALRHSNDKCAPDIQSKLTTYTQRITKTTFCGQARHYWPTQMHYTNIRDNYTETGILIILILKLNQP